MIRAVRRGLYYGMITVLVTALFGLFYGLVGNAALEVSLASFYWICIVVVLNFIVSLFAGILGLVLYPLRVRSAKFASYFFTSLGFVVTFF